MKTIKNCLDNTEIAHFLKCKICFKIYKIIEECLFNYYILLIRTDKIISITLELTSIKTSLQEEKLKDL